MLDGLHDYAQIYIDQKLIGSLDRRIGTSHLTLPPTKTAATLDILVENSGRVNFTKVIRGERKGLTGKVTLDGKEPQQWQIYSLPMDDLKKMQFASAPCEGPCFYRTQMTVPNTADTYLDTRAVHKGEAWINQHPLGRFWSIGPQSTLYVPGPWLRKGQNEIIYFDLMGTPTDALKSTTHPIFGASIAQRN